MANTYKTIGSSAAAVVSLLAIGTALWFQRTPGPINAPRPQDEAEIMTACLERPAAKGAPIEFVKTNSPVISTVADTNAPGGVRYVTNSPMVVFTNTIGFFPNATFAYPQTIRDSLAPAAGAYGTAGACVWLVPSNTYWQTGARDWNWTKGMLVDYLHANTNWWTNLVTRSVRTTLETAYTNIVTTNIASIINGYVVTSTEQRDGYNVAGYDYGGGVHEVLWPIGSAYAGNYDPESGLMFTIYDALGRVGYYGELYQVAFFTDYYGWWAYMSPGSMGWDSFGFELPQTLYGAFQDLTITEGSSTNYQTFRSQIIVTNTEPYNAWTAGKTFAFERDAKPYTWSTNAYNDMARALSLMQWQKNESSIVSCTNVVLRMYRADSSQTNAPYTYEFTTNHYAASPYYGGYHPSTVYFFMQLAGETTYDWAKYGGVFSGSMEGGIKCWRYAVTNTTCFAWDNVQIFASVTTNNSYIAPGATWTPTNLYNAVVTVTNYLPAGAGAISPWYPFSPDQAAEFLRTNMAAWSDNALPWTPVEIEFRKPGPYLAVNENQQDDVLDRCSEIAQGYLPYVNVEPEANAIAYHVQFSSLTNYLDHAPAR